MKKWCVGLLMAVALGGVFSSSASEIDQLPDMEVVTVYADMSGMTNYMIDGKIIEIDHLAIESNYTRTGSIITGVDWSDLVYTNLLADTSNWTTNVMSTISTYYPTTVTIGSVTIDGQTGKVTIEDGVELDEVTREFWQKLQSVFPEVFRDKVLRESEGEDGK